MSEQHTPGLKAPWAVSTVNPWVVQYAAPVHLHWPHTLSTCLNHAVARIVQCVNVHDELVAMLKEATDDYAANCEGGEADEWVGFARALLAKASA